MFRKLFGLKPKHKHEWESYDPPFEQKCFDQGDDFCTPSIPPSIYYITLQKKTCLICGKIKHDRVY